jgi:small Trp-rich protein
MWLVVLGLVLVGLKLLGLGFVAGWSWWLVLAPFALAAVWWKVADATGITQRQAMEREDKRAAQRREAQFESLGMRPPSAGRPTKPERPNRSDN